MEYFKINVDFSIDKKIATWWKVLIEASDKINPVASNQRRKPNEVRTVEVSEQSGSHHLLVSTTEPNPRLEACSLIVVVVSVVSVAGKKKKKRKRKKKLILIV